MGGTIRAEKNLGVGATFTFDALFDAVDDPTPLADLVALLRGRRALLVDDSPVWRSILASAVEALGIDADVASSGVDALEKLEAATEPYDIVFVDWLMPGWDGLQTRERIAELADPPTIVMVTASDLSELSRAAGAESLTMLAKPFTRSSLLDTVLSELEPAIRRRTNASASEAVVRVDGARVLLVEDHAINQEVGRGILTAAGAEVAVAADGAEGVHAVLHGDFDVVLMDIQMPVMDGWEATRRLRADPRSARVPIVAMTADVLPEHRERCFEVGMDDFISKPFVPADLIATVARWARGEAAGEEPGTGHDARPPSASEPPPAVLDEARALAHLDGDRELWLDSLERFDHELAAVFGAVEDLDPKDPGGVARALHTLKGLAATLGAMQLSALALALERQLADGGLPDTAVRDLRHAMDALSERSHEVRRQGGEG